MASGWCLIFFSSFIFDFTVFFVGHVCIYYLTRKKREIDRERNDMEQGRKGYYGKKEEERTGKGEGGEGDTRSKRRLTRW